MTKKVKLTEIADVERVKKDVVYREGTTIVQVSATDGQVKILREDTALETKYVALTPKINILPFYLYVVIEMAMPKFLNNYKTGLNIQEQAFKHMELTIHTDINKQLEIVRAIKKLEVLEEVEERAIKEVEGIKANMLDGLFI